MQSILCVRYSLATLSDLKKSGLQNFSPIGAVKPFLLYKVYYFCKNGIRLRRYSGTFRSTHMLKHNGNFSRTYVM